MLNFLSAKTFWEQIEATLITENRYMLYVEGLGNTLVIALGAIVIGLIVGLIMALITYINKRFNRLKLLSKLCNFCIYIVRGTPIVLQLMLMWFVILAFMNNAIIVAIISFGLNSAAYVAELFRGGLESVDYGQVEAGLSLGMNVNQTLTKVVIPQGFRTALPSLGNEFIALVKETSVVGYISILDVTFAASKIQTRTFDAFVPLIFSALIYLALVTILTMVLRTFERRMRKSDRR